MTFTAAPCGPCSASCPAPRRCSGHTSARRRLAAVVRAAADPAAAAPPPGGAAAAPLLALKEWAPTCAAISAGDQTILLRKGGIRESMFTPAARQFLLFPTAFHTDAHLLQPAAAARFASQVGYDPKAQQQLSFGTRAAITGAWTTYDPAVLQLLQELHVWTPAFLEQRLKWRPQQPITVLELRAVQLAAPLVVPPADDFFGCFSWVDLDAAAAAQQAQPLAGAGTPVLEDDAFAAAQQLCRQQLAQLGDLAELPF